ncbi:hypothetical protein D9M68_951300 [compost metagenome]
MMRTTSHVPTAYHRSIAVQQTRWQSPANIVRVRVQSLRLGKALRSRSVHSIASVVQVAAVVAASALLNRSTTFSKSRPIAHPKKCKAVFG